MGWEDNSFKESLYQQTLQVSSPFCRELTGLMESEVYIFTQIFFNVDDTGYTGSWSLHRHMLIGGKSMQKITKKSNLLLARSNAIGFVSNKIPIKMWQLDNAPVHPSVMALQYVEVIYHLILHAWFSPGTKIQLLALSIEELGNEHVSCGRVQLLQLDVVCGEKLMSLFPSIGIAKYLESDGTYPLISS